MILTTCAACAAPLAHNAPRCVRCHRGYQDATQVNTIVNNQGFQTSSDVSTTITNSIADCYENATISGTGVFSGTVPTSISINSGPWGTAGNSYDGVAEAMAEQWGTVI